jgi:farnesyl diphosphate synthase
VTRLSDAMAEVAASVRAELDSLIPASDVPEARLIEAMRYAVLDGGKRVRPFLVKASADLFEVADECALRAAAAIEMVHCYSLVHDDLPAMDDDELRRGRPTCHVKFDEATAILAGDALLTRAFGVLADDRTHPSPEIRCQLTAALAEAIGEHGMVGGQMLDLLAEDKPPEVPEVTRLQRMKTGALIGVACIAGGILGRATQPVRHALEAYAHDLGLAFQITDDLLDVEGDESDIGKRVRKDADRGKATFVSLLGAERAREQATLLAEQAVRHLDIFEEKADLLRDLARFVVERRA